jgi:murein DD-endopeptidase MepM/ murein hydrolase activator NlpD
MAIWETSSRLGLADTTLRIGTHALLVALILLVAWGLREFYLLAAPGPSEGGAFAAGDPTPSVVPLPAQMPDLPVLDPLQYGIQRKARLHTDVPSRPREEVSLYTVKEGDTLFGIAEKFGLEPETLLWSNQPVLGDNPHSLRPGQELNILPVNGAYYRWSAGDGLNSVARFFGVTPEDIIAYPANGLSAETIGDYASPNIEAGAWLVIPYGRREYVSWSAPAIPLDDPGVAKVLGPGACESVQGGVVGTGVFIWPADSHAIAGFDYVPEANHPGIDIDGEEGDPIYASDNGVVVYAGWNNWGYGNMIVVNHANGWQTLYAHLSSYYVACGQFVFQGNTIGAMGSTGNSTGSHLHFEMMFNGVRSNPHDYLP